MYESSQSHPTKSGITSSSTRLTAGEGGAESSPDRAPTAALGKKRQFVDAEGAHDQENKADQARKRRRERYADQRTAADIYAKMCPPGEKAAGRGVTLCGWTQIAHQETRLVRVDGDRPRAFYRGLCACSLRWVCPICTVHRSEKSRGQLNAALAVARQRGLRPVMLTLTARHSRKMVLGDFWAQLSTAEKRMKTTRPWKRLAARLGGGFAKAVEITHSERNGWHPHLHIVLMVEADDEAEAVAAVESLRSEWLHQLSRVGLDGKSKAAQQRAFDVRGAADVGSYITKWGAAEEMTLSTSKVGQAEGRTPWQLLRLARTGATEAKRRRAAALWWEFVQVMKGVHQLRQSPTFRELVSAYKPPKERPAEPEETVVMRYDESSWCWGRYRRLRMVEAAEGGTVEDAPLAVRAVLLGEATDTDLWREDIDPGPLIEDG